jgi:WD40 repeat protein
MVPAGKFLVSVGSKADRQMCIWDVETGTLLSRVVLKEEVSAVSVSADNNHITTIGPQHAFVWDIVHAQAGKV